MAQSTNLAMTSTPKPYCSKKLEAAVEQTVGRLANLAERIAHLPAAERPAAIEVTHCEFAEHLAALNHGQIFVSNWADIMITALRLLISIRDNRDTFDSAFFDQQAPGRASMMNGCVGGGERGQRQS